MRKTLQRFSDQLVSLVVPSTTAVAGCLPDPFTRHCSPYCPAPYKKARVQNCSYSGDCKLHCGPCYYVYGNCA